MNPLKKIGEGSFGCVFDNINCDNQIGLDESKKYVTKVLKKTLGEEEMRLANKIYQPGIEKYIIIKPIQCNVNVDETQMLAEMSNAGCDIKKYHDESPIYLTYEYGGQTLDKLLYNRQKKFEMYYAFKEEWITPSDSLYKFGKILACASTEVETILGYNPKTISLPIEPDTLAYPRFTFYSNLFVSLKNIVEAIQWLNKKHIYLNDLKEANLVYNGVMKIIDIGSIKLKIKEITNDKITIFKSSYNEYEKKLEGTYISPEKLYLPSTGNDPTVKVFRMTTRTNPLLEYTDIPTPTVKLILHPESCLKCIRDDNGYIQHITETVDSIDATYYTELTNYQRYCKIDIWALGQIMSNLHLQISQEFFELNELHEQINTSILSSMYNLIKNLLELNLDKRPDAAKALSLYIRYLTPELKKTNRKTLRKSANKKSASRLSIKNISTSGGKNTHKRKTYNRRRFRPCQLKRRINIKLN